MLPSTFLRDEGGVSEGFALVLKCSERQEDDWNSLDNDIHKGRPLVMNLSCGLSEAIMQVPLRLTAVGGLLWL